MRGCCYNICIMTMHTDSAKVLFIETLNPELKPQPCTPIASEKYKHVGGLWLFLGRICGMTNSSLLWSTETPRSSPPCGLHLLNYPVLSLISWLDNIHNKTLVCPHHKSARSAQPENITSCNLTTNQQLPLTVPYFSLVECPLVDSTLRLWCFTLHLLPLRLNNKIHPVRAKRTFLIIAAIIIMLVSQESLSGLCGPTASWMGTQRENGNQHPGFINLVVTRVEQKSLFAPFKGGCNQKQHLSVFPSQGKGKGTELCKHSHTCSPGWEYHLGYNWI